MASALEEKIRAAREDQSRAMQEEIARRARERRVTVDPMSKLHKDGKTAIDVGKRKAGSWWSRVRANWTPENTRLALAASGGGLAALALAGLASKIFGDKPPAGAVAGSGAAPPAPSPAKATERPGSTLTVTTKKKGQPGVLRAAPGLASPLVATVPSGTVVQVTGEAAMADTPAKRWYPVQVPGGKAGWMHSEILT